MQLAKKIGSTHIINSSKEDPYQAIDRILGPDKLDVFIDNTGIPEVIENGFSLIKNDGRLILVGVPKEGKNINIFSLPLHFGKVITGSHGGECNPEKDIPRYLDHINAKNLNMEELISKTYNIEKINEAINSMRNGETAGRVLITFN